MTKIITFFKKETVLGVAFLLAIFSCFLIKPDAAYLNYLDWHTLIVLFCLMAVMAGLKQQAFFEYIGEALLQKIQTKRSLVLTLVFLCFFSSMLITNDVALLTFVPLALLVLRLAKMQASVCLVITLMTIASNLGSMLTPIGNPQNLYLYSISGFSLPQFVAVLLPYTLLAAFGLVISVWLFFPKQVLTVKVNPNQLQLNPRKLAYYWGLFLVCLLSVAKILPPLELLLVILLAILFENRQLLGQVDYSLLLTFVCFFIFIGNLARVDAFSHLIQHVLDQNVRGVAILVSQIISNVPAALLLAGFSHDYQSLLIGTNLGGLGTLIASMASLISYKQLVANYPEQKGRFLLIFSLWNIIFLALLCSLGL